MIKYFFEKFDVNFLLHKFVYSNGEENQSMQRVEDMSAIESAFIKTYHEAWIVGYMLFGQPAFRREIFDQVHWPDIPIDEDNAFDNVVLTRFDNCLMIHVPLYLYRTQLSITPYELYR